MKLENREKKKKNRLERNTYKHNTIQTAGYHLNIILLDISWSFQPCYHLWTVSDKLDINQVSMSYSFPKVLEEVQNTLSPLYLHFLLALMKV